MIPALIGLAALSMASGLAGAIGKKRLSKEQMQRSQDLRTEAYGVKKPALRPEFQSALQASKLRTLYGLPNKQTMKDEVDLELATNLGRGKGAATSGGELLQYAASLGAEGSKLKRDINVQDAQMRDQNFGGYMNTLWNVGNEELKNVGIQREERNKLLAQSGALENAATANKFQGNTEIASSIFNAGGQALGGLAGKTGGSANGNSALPDSIRTKPSAQLDAGLTQNAISLNPKTTLAPVLDSRTLMDNGLTDADMAEIKAIMAQRPDLDIDEIIQMYKNTRKF